MPRPIQDTRQQRPKKAFGTAVDRRNGAKVPVSYMAQVEYFKPPDDIELEVALDAWEAYWKDQQSCLLTPSSKHLLMRWISALERYERLIAEADEEPTVTGSTGQKISNALYKVAYQALATAERLERQLGMGPLNAASLGLAALAERSGMEEINKTIMSDMDDDDDADYEDPR